MHAASSNGQFPDTCMYIYIYIYIYTQSTHVYIHTSICKSCVCLHTHLKTAPPYPIRSEVSTQIVRPNNVVETGNMCPLYVYDTCSCLICLLDVRFWNDVHVYICTYIHTYMYLVCLSLPGLRMYIHTVSACVREEQAPSASGEEDEREGGREIPP